MTRRVAMWAALMPGMAVAQTQPEAVLFGAREGVQQVSLSPDGTKIAFVAPGRDQGATLFTVSTTPGDTPKAALIVSGRPDRIDRCRWVSEARLVCTVWGVMKAPDVTLPLSYTRLFAVNADGGNQRMVSVVDSNRRWALFNGGGVIDWLPEQDGKILIARDYQRNDQTGTNVGSRKEGLGIDMVDTRTMSHRMFEDPKPDATEFITDGHGILRIAGYGQYRGETRQMTGVTSYRYRSVAGGAWTQLSEWDSVRREGFNPWFVDGSKNLAYGTTRVDGRLAVASRALDGSGQQTILAARDDVDVDGLIRIGRQQRVIGASYATDMRRSIYFDPAISALRTSLARALPKSPIIEVVDASNDETKLLIYAGADDDPGRYYLFDRSTKSLRPLVAIRPQLDGRTLAMVRAITYKAADGTTIPAYLTLPPAGATQGLPAIVLPHGGPSTRDEWGFDWLPQYFAARGYAVIQPNYRGSEGYGDDFYGRNAFQDWRRAIGDTADAGRYLVSSGIADPTRLVIFGWSYGGYAALQAAATYPGLFRAVAAIAPVTDLALLRDTYINFSNYRATADFLGNDLRAASPAQNAAAIKVPVLLVHGTLDRNVTYNQSTLMRDRLAGAGGKVELVTFPTLDHYLQDATARATLLEKSDALFRSIAPAGQAGTAASR